MGLKMFKINLSDGSTYILDREDAVHYKPLLAQLKTSKFQNMITAVSILRECGRKTKCPVCNRRADISCQACGESHGEGCEMITPYALVRPKDCKNVQFVLTEEAPEGKNKGFLRVEMIANGVLASLTVHNMQPSATFTLTTVGKMRYSPR